MSTVASTLAACCSYEIDAKQDDGETRTEREKVFPLKNLSVRWVANAGWSARIEWRRRRSQPAAAAVVAIVYALLALSSGFAACWCWHCCCAVAAAAAGRVVCVVVPSRKPAQVRAES